MLDALTLNFTLTILMFVYFVMSLIIFRIRKEKYLIYYLLTFLTLFSTYFLLFFQKYFPDWISFILMNLLVVLSQLFVVIGIRVLYRLKSINAWYLVYFLLTFIGIYYYTYIDFSITSRIIVTSMVLSLMLIDLIVIVRRFKDRVNEAINKIVITIAFISIIVWLSRIFFVFNQESTQRYLVDQGFTTGVYYILGLITSSVWFALYIWIETAQVVIKLEKKNDELSRLALIDNLTGLANRHYLDYDLKFLTSNSRRNNTDLSMLMVDLDRFKLVNDTFGHLVGDDVLKQAAQILSESIRSSDRVYRWGGEEFVIVTPSTNNKQASIVAEKISQNFRNSKFDVIGNITVSIGVATFDSDEKVEDWFNRVDLALYRAKQTGRNRWVTWLDDESLPEYFDRFAWKTEYESGNKEIDNDHKQLAIHINKLHHLITNQYPIDTIHKAIFDMTEHIKKHFILEESILLKKEYKEYTEHRSIHQRILSEYEILLRKTLNGEITLAALMSYLVKEVLIEHISNEDSKFFNTVK